MPAPFPDHFEITEISSLTATTPQAIAGLVGQLSTSAAPPTADELAEMVGSPATAVLVARDGGGRIVGMLTLVVFRLPTGVRALVEDVVVDADHRRQGIAEALTQEAVARARSAGARNVDLTSRPSREAANRLYQRMGFVLRETNVYRYALDAERGDATGDGA